MQLRLRLARTNHAFESDLQVLHVGGGALVEDHQIHRELFQAPVFVCLQQLPGDSDVFYVLDS